MPPQRKQAAEFFSDSGSDSENDAPEAVSLSQSKITVQQKEADVQQAKSAAKQKKRDENRERDRLLKERAEENKGKRKRAEDQVKPKKSAKSAAKKVEEDEDMDMEEDGDPELLARMQRAMEDAQGEDSMDEDEFDAATDDDDEFGGIDSAMDDDSDVDDPELDEDQELSVPAPKPKRTKSSSTKLAFDEPSKPKAKADYLPEELFAAAFQNPSTSTTSTKSKKYAAESTQKPRRKQRNTKSKDLVLGNRKIRVLASSTASRPSFPETISAPKKVKKFLDRTLALKGRAAKPQLGWERRPANIGVLRGSGPPSHFVRS